jgi:phosphate:Na+ symporter
MSHMPLSSIWEAFGGIGLFILGMNSMSEGLQKLAGQRLRRFLEKTTGNRLTAALMGSCLASLLQSSSAASILVIGFVNAGLISLYQALAVLLGTGIGATLVIQFIAFNISYFALPSIFFGVILKFFGRKRRLLYIGDLLLGAGLVFLGLQIMEHGLAPISQNALVRGLHGQFFSWRISAVLLGALLTFLIQSSSAATGIVIALASSGLLSLEVGVAIVVGEVIGSALITAVATINGTPAAKRTALIYFVINVFAVALVMLFFPLFLKTVAFFSPGDAAFIGPDIDRLATSFTQPARPYIARHLANAHTIFNVMSAILLLPLIGFFARSADKLLPGRKVVVDIEARPKYIDQRVLNTPSIALLQVKNELRRMAEIARSMFNDTLEQFNRYDAKRVVRIKQEEEVLDILNRDISDFLVLLSRRSLSSENSMEIPVMLHIINDLEHLGDQSEAIQDCLCRKKESNIFFSNTAISELKALAAKVSEIVNLSVDSMGNASAETLELSRVLKNAIKEMEENFNSNHITRLTTGKCTVVAGMIYSDIVNAFNKIAEYSFTIIETEKELFDAISISSD